MTIQVKDKPAMGEPSIEPNSTLSCKGLESRDSISQVSEGSVTILTLVSAKVWRRCTL